MVDGERRRYIEFQRSEASEVVEAVEALVARRDGSWVNIEPIIEREDLDAVRPPSPFLRLFSSRGPHIPFGTLVTADLDDKRPMPAQVGLQHGAGQKAVQQLAELGIEPGAGWRLLDDSPKRGMVYAIPEGYRVADVIEWIIVAATALSQIRIREHWSAVTHLAR